MEGIITEHLGADRFAIEIRDHVVTVDQPLHDGGEDTGPTPTELFVAGLVSCVAFYARRYLARHQLPTTGLTVTAQYSFGTHPVRVTDIQITIQPPADLPEDRLAPLLAMASHCTVHNTLKEPPEVTIGFVEPALAEI
jgi:putative redox protein